MDGLGCGLGDGVEFGFKSITRGIKKAGRAVGKVAKKVGKKAVSFAGPALAVAGAAGGAVGCSIIGVPPKLCAQGGAALGKAAGNALSKKLGVKPSELPLGLDPVAFASGDPQALMKVGQGLAKKAGLSVPLSPEELIFVAGRKAGLPPETLAVAQKGLAISKGAA